MTFPEGTEQDNKQRKIGFFKKREMIRRAKEQKTLRIRVRPRVHRGLEHDAKREQDYITAARSGDDAALFNLGVLYQMKGNLMLAELNYIMAGASGYTPAKRYLAVLYQKQGKSDLAELVFREAAFAGDV